MTKKEKKQIVRQFIAEIEKISVELIDTDDQLKDPLETVRMACDYIEDRFNEQSIGTIRLTALGLWNDGWRGDTNGVPLDKSKPLIPEAIASEMGVTLKVARLINHQLVSWSIGTVKLGEYDKL